MNDDNAFLRLSSLLPSYMDERSRTVNLEGIICQETLVRFFNIL